MQLLLSSISIQVLVISRLDYCDSVPYGLWPLCSASPSNLLHAPPFSKGYKDVTTRDHVTHTLHQPHCLPIQTNPHRPTCQNLPPNVLSPYKVSFYMSP